MSQQRTQRACHLAPQRQAVTVIIVDLRYGARRRTENLTNFLLVALLLQAGCQAVPEFCCAPQHPGFLLPQKGDGGNTAKTVAFQIYSLDDLDQVEDYYACFYSDEDSYRLNYYKDRFSPERTNFRFYVTDNSGVVYYTNARSGASGVADEFRKAGYSGSSSFFIYDEKGETIPLRISRKNNKCTKERIFRSIYIPPGKAYALSPRNIQKSRCAFR